MKISCGGGYNLTIIEMVKDTFAGRAPGTSFTTREIIEMVQKKYSVNKASVIPSDYCYNMDNKGNAANASLDKFKLFEWEARGKYVYRGENYHYDGPVLRNPREK